MYRKLIAKRNAEVKKLYAQGLSVSFIAEQFQMKPREVRGVVSGRNIKHVVVVSLE